MATRRRAPAKKKPAKRKPRKKAPPKKRAAPKKRDFPVVVAEGKDPYARSEYVDVEQITAELLGADITVQPLVHYWVDNQGEHFELSYRGTQEFDRWCEYEQNLGALSMPIETFRVDKEEITDHRGTFPVYNAFGQGVNVLTGATRVAGGSRMAVKWNHSKNRWEWDKFAYRTAISLAERNLIKLLRPIHVAEQFVAKAVKMQRVVQIDAPSGAGGRTSTRGYKTTMPDAPKGGGRPEPPPPEKEPGAKAAELKPEPSPIGGVTPRMTKAEATKCFHPAWERILQKVPAVATGSSKRRDAAMKKALVLFVTEGNGKGARTSLSKLGAAEVDLATRTLIQQTDKVVAWLSDDGPEGWRGTLVKHDPETGWRPVEPDPAAQAGQIANEAQEKVARAIDEIVVAHTADMRALEGETGKAAAIRIGKLQRAMTVAVFKRYTNGRILAAEDLSVDEANVILEYVRNPATLKDLQEWLSMGDWLHAIKPEDVGVTPMVAPGSQLSLEDPGEFGITRDGLKDEA